MTPDFATLEGVLVRQRSIRVLVVAVILVDSFINCSMP